jgi:hypothetical protein
MINFHNEIPEDKNLLDLINELRERIEGLEMENVEVHQHLYELHKQIEAVDNRIDIVLQERENF